MDIVDQVKGIKYSWLMFIIGIDNMVSVTHHKSTVINLTITELYESQVAYKILNIIDFFNIHMSCAQPTSVISNILNKKKKSDYIQ